MDLESTRTLRGPNKWSNSTVVEGVVNLADLSLEAIPTHVENCIEELPASARAGVLAALAGLQGNGQAAATLMAELALASEQTLGCEVAYRQAVDTTTQ